MDAEFSQSTAVSSDSDLLELYLSLPSDKRDERFINTARAAQLTGLSVRTIQFWIETEVIQAIVIGNKYQVDLDSLRSHLKRQLLLKRR